MDLLAWWNLVFVLPFLGALTYLLFQAFSGLGLEHDVDAAVDHDVDMGHDFGLDHGVEHSAEIGHGHAEAHGAGDNMLAKALGVLGVGRVPVSLLAIAFCFIWGFSGWASNTLLAGALKYPAIYFWPSLGIAFVSALVFTNLFARGMSRIMPSTETYGTSNRQLVGRRAKAIYEITGASGSARLRDDYGNLLDVSCRVGPDEPAIPAGSPVVLFRYDPHIKSFLVKRDSLGDITIPSITDITGKEED